MSDLKDLIKEAEAIRLKYEELNAKQGKSAWGIRDYAMRFMGDVGDLQKLVLDKENLRGVEDIDGKLAHELADCLWSVLIIANYYGLDLEKEFKSTLKYISKRVEGAKT